VTELDGPWNHNIHYHPIVLDLARDCDRALDVGCGEGVLARQLRPLVGHVTAIDLDQPSIALARRMDPSGEIDFLLGDFLEHPFEPESFDLIASVATLHHLDAAVALRRMRDLLSPGGRLALVGCARSRVPLDLPWDLAGSVSTRLHTLTKTYWRHSAPVVWPPPMTYPQMRRLAAAELPGGRFRRHLLWRYSLVWTKPGRPPVPAR
jgi:SAM-dependent methyltransferase